MASSISPPKLAGVSLTKQTSTTDSSAFDIYSAEFDGLTLEDGIEKVIVELGGDWRLRDILPDDFNPLSKVRLLSATCVCASGAATIDHAWLKFSLDAGWSPLPGILTLGAPVFELVRHSPPAVAGRASRTRWELTLSETVKLDNVEFAVTVDLGLDSLRSPEIHVQLAPNNTIGLGTALARLLPFSLPLPILNRDISSCTIHGDLSSRAVTMNISIEGGASLGKGLDFEFLRLTALASPGHSCVELSGVIDLGTIAVEAGSTDIKLDASASYDGNTKGLQLDARWIPQSLDAVPFSSLAKALLTKVLDTEASLPEALSDFRVKQLSLAYDTGTGHVDALFAGTLKIGENTSLSAAVNLSSWRNPNGKRDVTLDGQITLEDEGKRYALDLSVDRTAGSSAYAASLATGDGPALSLTSLLTKFGVAASDDLPGGKLGISALTLAKAAPATLVALDLEGSFDLSAISLPGLPISTGGTDPLTFALRASYVTGGNIKDQDIDRLNAALPSSSRPLKKQKPGSSGLSVAVEVVSGGVAHELPMPIAPARNNSGGGLIQPSAEAPSSPFQWLAIQKKFGPVSIERIGVQLKASDISVAFDAGLAMGPLHVSLIELVVRSKLNAFEPHVSLAGLGISWSGGGMAMTGVLRHIPPAVGSADGGQFAGFASLKGNGMMLEAMGTLQALADGQSSLFIYGALLRPIGGPSFCYVTGVAAGFGLNRRLCLPPLDKISDFPLVHKVLWPDDDTLSGSAMLAAIVRATEGRSGAVFAALGMKFTSFKLIDSFALVIVGIGEKVEIDILGVATLTVPPNLPPSAKALARAELQFQVKLRPEDGTLSFAGQLSPSSYLFTPDCRLTGGFAGGAWLIDQPATGAKAGDFVYSFGGYHPAYKIPGHFPANVQRVGFNWQVDSHLTMRGHLYYALTSTCYMVGGGLNAEFNCGALHAWFNCGADFLINFKPFHYDAHLYISMGLRVSIHILFGTLHLEFDAGADLALWGPPLTGHAHVHVHVCGFTVSRDVSFGGSPDGATPISWTEFATSFLQHENGVLAPLSMKVEAGLAGTCEVDGETIWIVNPREFVLTVASQIPAHRINIAHGSGTETLGAEQDLDIRPMGLTHRHGAPISLSVDTTKLVFAHHRQHVPTALWGEARLTDSQTLAKPDLNEPRLIENTLVGARMAVEAVAAEASFSVPRDNLLHATGNGGIITAGRLGYPRPVAAAPETAATTTPAALPAQASNTSNPTVSYQNNRNASLANLFPRPPAQQVLSRAAYLNALASFPAPTTRMVSNPLLPNAGQNTPPPPSQPAPQPAAPPPPPTSFDGLMADNSRRAQVLEAFGLTKAPRRFGEELHASWLATAPATDLTLGKSANG